MSRFEEICASTQEKARDAALAAKGAERLAKNLAKAAAEGDHAKIRRFSDELRAAATAFGATASVAVEAWTFDDDSFVSYLETGYERDLIAAGAERGVVLGKLDDRLAAFPVVVQLLPKQRAVKIDAARTSALRPSVVIDRIQQQQKRQHIKPDAFIELLYRAYSLVVNHTKTATGATLDKIFDVFTLHPEAKKNYSRSEFARDVFLLDTSVTRKTKSGAIVSFPASTGTKGSSKTFFLVPPDGMPKHYYAIRFQEVAR